jgi:hypothetical protein
MSAGTLWAMVRDVGRTLARRAKTMRRNRSNQADSSAK